MGMQSLKTLNLSLVQGWLLRLPLTFSVVHFQKYVCERRNFKTRDFFLFETAQRWYDNLEAFLKNILKVKANQVLQDTVTILNIYVHTLSFPLPTFFSCSSQLHLKKNHTTRKSNETESYWIVSSTDVRKPNWETQHRIHLSGLAFLLFILHKCLEESHTPRRR